MLNYVEENFGNLDVYNEIEEVANILKNEFDM